MSAVTPLEAAQLLVNAFVKDKCDIDGASIWTKKGTRIYITEDGSPVGYVEILTGKGMKAIGGDCADRSSIVKSIKRVMKDLVVAEAAATELSSGGAADRIATELRQRGYDARVWAKKGTRVYIDRDGEELGYLEVADAVTNRSKLAQKLVDEVSGKAVGKAQITKPADPKQRAKLLAAIRDDPDDDGPRSVYADWLQTHGDPIMRARGEFIVAQLAGKDDAKYLADYADKWHGQLLGGNDDYAYERGMLTSVRSSIHDLGKNLGGLVANEPVLRRLRITSWGSEWTRAHHEAMDFTGPYATGWSKIAPHFGGIEHLECVGWDIAPSIVELAASKQAAKLIYLDIHEAKVDEGAIIALAKSKTLSSLATLDLRGNPLSVAAAEALLATKLPLRKLTFGKCADTKLSAALKSKFRA